MTYPVSFLCGLVLDFFFAWYTLSVSRGHVLSASVASVACAIPGLVGVTMVVSDWTTSISYVAGLFCGTLCYMLLSRNRL